MVKNGGLIHMITSLLIFITVAIHFYLEYQGFGIGGTTNTLLLQVFGANDRNFVLNYGEYWRWFTAMFIHIGWQHLLGNMLSLYWIGRGLERQMGSIRYLFLYIGSGIAGNALTTYMGTTLSAGASTAVFGVLAGSVIYAFSTRGGFPLAIRIISVIAVNLVLNIFQTGVDLWGHVGGAVGGLVIALVFRLTQRSWAKR